jgi:hypothetical protein
LSTTFPGSGLDNFTLVPALTKLGDIIGARTHRAFHNDMGDAIEAIEAKLGLVASTPIADRILGGTGAGTSAYRQVTTADLVAQAVTQFAGVVVGTTDPVINSISAVQIGVTSNPTTTLTTTGGPVLVFASMEVNASASTGIGLYIRNSIGNSFVQVGQVDPPSSAGRWHVSGFHLFTPMPAATYVFDLGWNSTAGVNVTSYGGTRRIWAMEIKR